jgi:hypothetical protein
LLETGDFMVKDTSKYYDAMVGYVAEENLNKSSLDTFLGIEEEKEYRPDVRKKEVDSEFPEDWQKLWVNFNSMEDYTEFMNKIGSKPAPKLKYLVYGKPGSNSGIFDFME